MILNRDKIRADVLEVFDASMKIQARAIFKFMRKYKDSDFDFKEVWKRILKANNQFFKKEKTFEELSTLLTQEEMLIMAKLHRFAFEFTGTITQKKNPLMEGVELEVVSANGVPAEWQRAEGSQKDKVILYLHGGGYIMGSPHTHRLLTVALGKATNMTVLSVDYRLGPEHKYPAPVEDSTTVYKWLLDTGINPKNVIISGDSAGGHLTLLTLLKLRDDGIALPAGAVPISPLTDGTTSGESFFKNAETDPILADVGIFWWLNAAMEGMERSDPRISPIKADLSGLPPLFFQVSRSEMLYSDSVRCFEKAKADGVDATLEAWEDMPHVFQLFGLGNLPESDDAILSFAEFAQKILL